MGLVRQSCLCIYKPLVPGGSSPVQIGGLMYRRGGLLGALVEGRVQEIGRPDMLVLNARQHDAFEVSDMLASMATELTTRVKVNLQKKGWGSSAG